MKDASLLLGGARIGGPRIRNSRRVTRINVVLMAPWPPRRAGAPRPVAAYSVADRLWPELGAAVHGYGTTPARRFPGPPTLLSSVPFSPESVRACRAALRGRDDFPRRPESAPRLGARPAARLGHSTTPGW